MKLRKEEGVRLLKWWFQREKKRVLQTCKRCAIKPQILLSLWGMATLLSLAAYSTIAFKLWIGLGLKAAAIGAAWVYPSYALVRKIQLRQVPRIFALKALLFGLSNGAAPSLTSLKREQPGIDCSLVVFIFLHVREVKLTSPSNQSRGEVIILLESFRGTSDGFL